jgi:PHD/YefM family antitoxin component YafN of YafNO toxin-antitoxin module
MDFVAVKDLKAPAKLRKRLNDAKTLIVTNNGKPMAIMLPVADGKELELTLEAISRARFDIALRQMRATARQNGTSEMTLEEINEEIAAARRERRQQCEKK